MCYIYFVGVSYIAFICSGKSDRKISGGLIFLRELLWQTKGYFLLRQNRSCSVVRVAPFTSHYSSSTNTAGVAPKAVCPRQPFSCPLSHQEPAESFFSFLPFSSSHCVLPFLLPSSPSSVLPAPSFLFSLCCHLISCSQFLCMSFFFPVLFSLLVSSLPPSLPPSSLPSSFMSAFGWLVSYSKKTWETAGYLSLGAVCVCVWEHNKKCVFPLKQTAC